MSGPRGFTSIIGIPPVHREEHYKGGYYEMKTLAKAFEEKQSKDKAALQLYYAFREPSEDERAGKICNAV